MTGRQLPAGITKEQAVAAARARGEDTFADKLLSALRFQFGGHEEKTAAGKEGA